jgi:hypothetical protein
MMLCKVFMFEVSLILDQISETVETVKYFNRCPTLRVQDLPNLFLRFLFISSMQLSVCYEILFHAHHEKVLFSVYNVPLISIIMWSKIQISYLVLH